MTGACVITTTDICRDQCLVVGGGCSNSYHSEEEENNDDNDNNMDTSMVSNAGSLGRSYSILDNNVQTPSNDDDASMDSAEDNNSDKKGGAQRLKRQVT